VQLDVYGEQLPVSEYCGPSTRRRLSFNDNLGNILAEEDRNCDFAIVVKSCR